MKGACQFLVLTLSMNLDEILVLKYNKRKAKNDKGSVYMLLVEVLHSLVFTRILLVYL